MANVKDDEISMNKRNNYNDRITQRMKEQVIELLLLKSKYM